MSTTSIGFYSDTCFCSFNKECASNFCYNSECASSCAGDNQASGSYYDGCYCSVDSECGSGYCTKTH